MPMPMAHTQQKLTSVLPPPNRSWLRSLRCVLGLDTTLTAPAPFLQHPIQGGGGWGAQRINVAEIQLIFTKELSYNLYNYFVCFFFV